jgi:hypothetical protein
VDDEDGRLLFADIKNCHIVTVGTARATPAP